MKKLVLLMVVALIYSCGPKKNEYDPYKIPSSSKKDVKKSSFEIEFKKTAANLKTVHIKLNGANGYDALFDTGCSGMLISKLECFDMAKSGTINQNDYIGKTRATIADGSEIEQPVYNIREVTVIDKDGKPHTLRDIKAAVVENLEADILIGNTIIDNLAKNSYTVDLNKKVIRFQ